MYSWREGYWPRNPNRLNVAVPIYLLCVYSCQRQGIPTKKVTFPHEVLRTTTKQSHQLSSSQTQSYGEAVEELIHNLLFLPIKLNIDLKSHLMRPLPS